MKPLLFIPCYNHTEEINNLIYNIKKYYNEHILIIDDGSTDDIQLNHSEHIKLMKNKFNKGKGYSILKASKYMLTHNYTHMIVMDSDSQHDPSKLKEFLSIDPSINLVYGRRVFKKPMPISRIFSNTFTSAIISILCNKRIYDAQCGYRRYADIFFKDYEYNELGYQFESEILLKCINSKSNIEYVNIPTIYNGNISSMNYITDTLKFLRCILKNIF